MAEHIQTDSSYVERRGRKDNRRRELAGRVAADIRTGKLTGKLPGVTRMAALYDSCPATMQRVVQMLADEGLVEVRPYSGTYVRSHLEVFLISFYDPDIPSSNMRVARNSTLDNYSQLYQGLYDTLRTAGVPLSFQMLGLYDNEQLRLLKRRNHHFVAILPFGRENICYEHLAGCRWTRVMGMQDYNCPVAHVTYDNSRIGGLAAHDLMKAGCNEFVFIGSSTSALFRQRFDTFQAALTLSGKTARLLEINYSIGLPEIAGRLRIFAGENADALNCGQMGLFCCADAFLPLLYQTLASAVDLGKVRLVSCDNNPHFLQGIFPVPHEIDICTYEIGVMTARHILSSPETMEKTAVLPRFAEDNS